MSYQVYTTEAIVCGSLASQTADKAFYLFTKSAGMVYAKAKSVREERSRQRYALQDFSQVNVSLVQGKTGWRIGSVDTTNNFYVTAKTREARGSVVKLIKHLRRYVQGEEPNPALFNDILAGLHLLSQDQLASRAVFEQFLLVRILHQLGYVALPTEFINIFTLPILEVTVDQYQSATLVCEPLLATARSVSHL